MFLYEALEAIDRNSCTWVCCHQGFWDLGSDQWWNLAKTEQITLSVREGRYAKPVFFSWLKTDSKAWLKQILSTIVFVNLFALSVFNGPFPPDNLEEIRDFIWIIVTEPDMWGKRDWLQINEGLYNTKGEFEPESGNLVLSLSLQLTTCEVSTISWPTKQGNKFNHLIRSFLTLPHYSSLSMCLCFLYI